MATMIKAVRKYLERYAEPEARLADEVRGRFGHVLVIPACGEGDTLFEALESVPRGPLGEPLTIVVVNARADAPAWVHERNGAALKRLGRASRPAFIVDRATPGRFLPAGQGVGLARKIGADIALRLRALGKIGSEWMHGTDADVRLPPDYFERAAMGERRMANGEAVALVYPFEHLCDPEPALAQVVRLYEISLRYYVLGLASAGSPYAYHSIGSTIAIRADAYAAVRGFPKRAAAEDFYLLNKLAKVGPIVRLGGEPIGVEGRLSERVPFGTGRALSRIGRGGEFLTYDPAVFKHLAAWIRVLDDFASRRGQADPRAVLRSRSEERGIDGELLRRVLERMDAFAAAEGAARRSGDATTLARHLHTWFDAFRTLKLIHGLRDGGLASVRVTEAISRAAFLRLPKGAAADDLEELRRHLARQEEALVGRLAGVSER